MSTPGIARANRLLDARHFSSSPAHGDAIAHELLGMFRALHARWPDDPALAAEDALDMLRRAEPRIAALRAWAEDTAHQSLAPAPEHGARVE